MASIGEANLLRLSMGLFPALPGMNGPVNTRRMDEISAMMETFRDALIVEATATAGDGSISGSGSTINEKSNFARVQAIMELFRALAGFWSDDSARFRQDAEPLFEELQSVIQMVAVEVLEIRGARAMRSILRVVA